MLVIGWRFFLLFSGWYAQNLPFITSETDIEYSANETQKGCGLSHNVCGNITKTKKQNGKIVRKIVWHEWERVVCVCV